jgi:hypothetical protein
MDTTERLMQRNSELRAAVTARQGATVPPPADVPREFFEKNPGCSLRPATPATVPDKVPRLLRASVPPEQLDAAWAAVKSRQRPIRIIGFCGAAGSGKSLAAQMVPEAEVIQLADPLYAMLAAMLGVTEEQLRDQQYKRTPIDWIQKSPRELLQTLGTEWGRQSVREDLWLIMAGRLIDELVADGVPIVCIADVRFDNEAAMIRDRGGQVWQIVRQVQPLPSDHVSERGLSESLIDRVIANDGDIGDLRRSIEQAVAECK